VIVVVNNTVHAVIAIADPIKPNAPGAIAAFETPWAGGDDGLGDSKRGAEAVAKEVGIDELLAEFCRRKRPIS